VPKIKYTDRKFSAGSLDLITKANAIIEDYQAQGYDLTLRQLYYQFVSKGWIANKDSEYKRLGSVVSDGRLAGLIDWEAITDRTRNLRANSHWSSPSDIIDSAAASFALDKWDGQEYRPEVWIEKDALVGVLETACAPLDVAYFSCRGYTSISEVWVAARRLRRYRQQGQVPAILHLGDHDPSGIDMSRDIQDRLTTFGVKVEFRRLALNMDQVHQYNPPPNPAKLTDSRAQNAAGTGYVDLYGDSSWELDALPPTVLAGLINAAVESFRDDTLWEEKVAAEEAARRRLRKAAHYWGEVTDLVDGMEDIEG
jgi:hypothetical protein